MATPPPKARDLSSYGILPPPASTKFSLIVEGPPKEGKTHFATTMPDPTFLVADQNFKAHEAHGVRYFPILSWPEWLQKFRPAITERLFPGKTIVIDTASQLFRKLEAHVAQGKDCPQGYNDWSAIRTHIIKFADDLNSARTPKTMPDGTTHPGYHICVLVHQKIESDETGKLLAYLPDISTKLDNSFAGLFDAHFNTGKTVTYGPSGPKASYVLRSVPETAKHRAGDNLGGPGKKYAELPPTIENSFPALLKAWGAEEEVEW